MPRLTRILALVAALAVSVLAAPSALARPADTLSPQARNAAATASSDRAQDLRRLDAGNDIRTPRPLAQEAYYSSYGSPPAAQQSSRTVSTDDGAPWTTIALGLAAACLLIAMLAVARRARLRTHIAA